jgi:hypothetical protein
MTIWHGCIAAILIGVSACAAPRAPAIDARTLFVEQVAQGQRVLRQSVAARARLADLELALTTAGAPFCGDLVQPVLGGVFGTRGAFSGVAAKAAASIVLGPRDEPGVAHVSPGGPLAAAGIEPGDLILEVDGSPVPTMEDLAARLGAAGRAIDVVVEREGESLQRTIAPVLACPVGLSIALSPALVTWQPSPLVGAVPLGLMNAFEDDGQLAVVLAHQLSHLLFDRASDDALAKERRADRIGLFLAARAGYDVSGAEKAWASLAAEYPWLVGVPAASSRFAIYPHGGLALRMETIRATVREIAQRRADGRPLVPSNE